MLRRLHDALFAPIDSSILALLRVSFGGIMVWECWRYYSKGWIEHFYIQPALLFSYYGFDWVQPWSGDGMYWHFGALALLAFFIAIGFLYRASAFLFALGFSYVFLLDQSHFLNHLYLVSVLSGVMVFVPAHRAFSVDAWLRPSVRSATAPAWTLWLLRFEIGLPYFFGGIAKISYDWMYGEPMRTWLARSTDWPVVGPLLTEEWVVYLFSWSGMLFDLLVVPALLWRRTRIPAYAAALGFHLFNATFFSIGIFPWFMILATLIFFPPAWPRELAARFLGPARAGSGGPSSPAPSVAWQRVAVVALAAFVLVNLVVPLRHYAYPGNVRWTAEGLYFAWLMKSSEIRSSMVLYTENLATGERRPIDYGPFLIQKQIRALKARPEMILQFSHWWSDHIESITGQRLPVYAKVTASLNGRDPQLRIDPNVNLVEQPRGLHHKDWILPLTQPLRVP